MTAAVEAFRQNTDALASGGKERRFLPALRTGRFVSDLWSYPGRL